MGIYDDALAKALTGGGSKDLHSVFIGQPICDLEKAHVKAHFRRDPKTGKLIHVADFDDSRHKGEEFHKIQKGDKMRVNNPRSKHHGKVVEVLHYSDKYGDVRTKAEGQNHTADFKPHHLEHLESTKIKEAWDKFEEKALVEKRKSETPAQRVDRVRREMTQHREDFKAAQKAKRKAADEAKKKAAGPAKAIKNLTELVKFLRSSEMGMTEEGGNGRALAINGNLKLIRPHYYRPSKSELEQTVQGWTSPGGTYAKFFKDYGIDRFELVSQTVDDARKEKGTLSPAHIIVLKPVFAGGRDKVKPVV